MDMPRMYQYWQPHHTSRTFAIAGVGDGTFYFGCANDTLFRHDVRTGVTEAIHLPALKGRPLSACVHLDGWIYILMQRDDAILRYRLCDGATEEIAVPEGANIWYGTSIPERRLLICPERAGNQVVVYDAESGAMRTVPVPYEGRIYSGRIIPGEDAYLCMLDGPSGVCALSLETWEFLWHLPTLDPDAGFGGGEVIEGRYYMSECYGGRMHCLDMATRRWEEPLPIPGYMEVFGYVGGGTAFRGKLYCSMSNLAVAPRFDAKANTLTLDTTRGIDGKPHNFMDMQLVFDPATGEFDFLKAEHGDDTYPLLCYQAVANDTLLITGTDILAYRNEEPEYKPGRLLVLQSVPAQG